MPNKNFGFLCTFCVPENSWRAQNAHIATLKSPVTFNPLLNFADPGWRKMAYFQGFSSR